MKVATAVVVIALIVASISVAFNYAGEDILEKIRISEYNTVRVSGTILYNNNPVGASVTIINPRTGEYLHASASNPASASSVNPGVYNATINASYGDTIIVFARNSYNYGATNFTVRYGVNSYNANVSLSYYGGWSDNINRSEFSSRIDYSNINYSGMPHYSDRTKMPKNRWVMEGNVIEFWFSEPIYSRDWRPVWWSVWVTTDTHEVLEFWTSTNANQPPYAYRHSAPPVLADVAIAALPKKDAGMPVADAGTTYWSEVNNPITFDGSGSYDPDGYIVSYHWDFGDGKSADGMVVQHTYTSATNGAFYPVKLTVTDNDGKQAVDWARAYINPPGNNRPPVAAFTYTPTENIYPGTTIHFDGSGSYDPDGTITAYSWWWDDGSGDANPYPTANHTFKKPGVYHVSLEVQDNWGVTNYTVKEIVVGELPKYHLNIQIEGSGTVEKDPNQTEYPSGTEVNLTAIPDDGWVFKYWYYSGTNDHIVGNPITVTMDMDKSIVAVFERVEPNYYILSVSSQPQNGGTVTASPAAGQYSPGTIVTLTAHANSGYRFTGWSGDVNSKSPTIRVTMNSDKTVTANFEKVVAQPIEINKILPILIIIIAMVAAWVLLRRRQVT